jgi:hypothetical protein
MNHPMLEQSLTGRTYTREPSPVRRDTHAEVEKINGWLPPAPSGKDR